MLLLRAFQAPFFSVSTSSVELVRRAEDPSAELKHFFAGSIQQSDENFCLKDEDSEQFLCLYKSNFLIPISAVLLVLKVDR
jgi:hypothetical protein